MDVKLYVDAWDPSYGSPLDPGEGGPVGDSSAQLNLDVEVPAGSWRPLAAPPDLRPPEVVLLVDGVRRIDARVWVEEPDGTLHPGIAASYAAGVVRCDLRGGLAVIAAAKIARGLFTPSPGATDLTAGTVRYSVRRVAVAEPGQLATAVQPYLHQLEVEVSHLARAISDADFNDLLVLDGPLRGRAQLPRALGYVKTHRVQYLPPQLSTVVGQLAPGQRSPVFLLGTTWHRYTWYLKLPGPPGSPWAGVVRVEASADLPRGQAVALADLSAVTLPRFASLAYKDPRAPQNLAPIAGLERKLRSMLGSAPLLYRSLVAATARPSPGAATTSRLAARPAAAPTDRTPAPTDRAPAP